MPNHESSGAERPVNESLTELGPTGELRQYPDGTDQVYKTPGDQFSMTRLRIEFMNDPVACGVGSVMVQTLGADGSRRKLFFDAQDILLDDRDTVDPLEPVRQAEQAHDKIIVGQPWNSPIGLTDEVTHVVLPFLGGIDPVQAIVQPANSHSFTRQGRDKLNLHSGRPLGMEPIA